MAAESTKNVNRSRKSLMTNFTKGRVRISSGDLGDFWGFSISTCRMKKRLQSFELDGKKGTPRTCKVPLLAEHGKHAQVVHHARARLQGSIIIFYFSSFS